MSKRTSKKDPFAAREREKYENPIPSREFIISHLNQRKEPATFQELMQELKLDQRKGGEEAGEQEGEAELALHRRLKAMVRDLQLERLKGGYFWPAGHRILVKGKVQFERGKKNKAYVIPDDGSTRILIIPDETHSVYSGNRVVISVLDIESIKKSKSEKIQKVIKEREGHLVEVLEQQRIAVTGRFVSEKNINYVIPHGKEFTQDILILPGRENCAKDGDIVIVHISPPSSPHMEPMGDITEILGHEDAPGIEILAASRAYGLPEIWPEIVQNEIKHLSESIPESAKLDRLDLRHLPLVTIDGEDAKDFDDAVYCEKLKSGGYRLYVAIADVSHYVKPNTALDQEARQRGNSVYFPGKVIPMLPELLSNGLCSLKPDVERLCMVCVLNLNEDGKITRYEFHEGIMRSKARLTYTKVWAILNESSEHLREQYQELIPHLEALNQLYQILKSAREVRGAIEFETLETRIIFGKNGKISKIEPITRNDAHKIIEECMLVANVATAKFLKKHKLPGLYRIHEGPPQDKLADLRVFLQELGLKLGGGKEPQPIDYARLLASIQHRKDANVIQVVLLRSLSQAIYSPDNVGHFGLAYSEYCHFTSPIRRYPDLLVHRQIRTVLQGKWTETMQEAAKTEEAKEALIALGDHSSMTERRADDATRDAVRWLKCEYIEKHIGDIFEGIISGVTRFGFFVELKDIFIDGLVHVTSLKDDYYNFDAVHHRLIGERTGTVFKLSDPVKVKVTRVVINERKIDFELMEMPGSTRQSKKEMHQHRSKKRPKNARNETNDKNKSKGKFHKKGKNKQRGKSSHVQTNDNISQGKKNPEKKWTNKKITDKDKEPQNIRKKKRKKRRNQSNAKSKRVEE